MLPTRFPPRPGCAVARRRLRELSRSPWSGDGVPIRSVESGQVGQGREPWIFRGPSASHHVIDPLSRRPAERPQRHLSALAPAKR